jgi:hypothetical protein
LWHSVIICVVLPWRTYEMHLALSLKPGCDRSDIRGNVEHKRVQLGDLKRKAIAQGQGSSSVCPRYVPPQGTPARPGGGPRPAQYAP